MSSNEDINDVRVQREIDPVTGIAGENTTLPVTPPGSVSNASITSLSNYESSSMKKYLPLLGVVFFFAALALFLVAFAMRTLTEDQRWILMVIFSLFAGSGAGCFTGSLDVRYSSGLGLAVMASGGFGTWFLTPWLFPAPKGSAPVHVQLIVQNNGGIDGGEFELSYRRPNLGPATIIGTNGRVTISDMPAGATSVEVIQFNHPRLEIISEKQEGVWKFPISQGRDVSIPVRDAFIPPAEPTKSEMLERIAIANLTEKEILEVKKEDEQKKSLVLTVKNSAGRDFELWVYDCWWCFASKKQGSPLRSKYMDVVRFKDTDPIKKEFAKFASLNSTSGYFGLFILYDKNGKWHRQYMGIHNLFLSENPELVVELTSNANEPFILRPAP